MIRSHNFSAGPSALPFDVLKQAHEEFFDFAGTGMSVMEISHRSDWFAEIAYQAELDLRSIINIPSNYKVLFLHGGASLQFSQVPMNLLRGKNTADYVHTGLWSGKAIAAAKRYCSPRIVASSESTGFDRVPKEVEWEKNQNAAYLHYTDNETVHGVQFRNAPDSAVPLVCDACSSLLSKPIDVKKHGLIYAASQKNMGAAGVTLVIVNERLLDAASATTPDILSYHELARANSMLNTPSTFSWYLTGLTLKWIIRTGGIETVHQMNRTKASLMYEMIDSSGGFYINHVQPEYRSINNVPFFISNPDLERVFISEADRAGLKGLGGHATVGGVRASIYNAVTISAVNELVDFMKEFQRVHG